MYVLVVHTIMYTKITCICEYTGNVHDVLECMCVHVRVSHDIIGCHYICWKLLRSV